jgi:hypothetical protein
VIWESRAREKSAKVVLGRGLIKLRKVGVVGSMFAFVWLSGHRPDIVSCPLSANRVLTHRSKTGLRFVAV